MYYRRNPRPLALLLAFMMLFSLMGTALASEPTSDATVYSTSTSYPTYQEAYQRMLALQSKYPEGMEFTNSAPYNLSHSYNWHGGSVKGANGGVGCAAFAFELSDAAFGSLPCRVLDQGEFTFDDIKVGDILRITNAHFVIVLRKSTNGVIVAEANYNKSVHWGRAINASEVMNSVFIVTRYPANFVPSDAADANTIIGSGTTGNLSWNVTNSGTLTISGNDAIPDFSATDKPDWETYDNKIVTIVIEEGITGIGSYAFSNSQAISINIPRSVQFISNDAFHRCSNLTSITLPEGITHIGERAFKNCISLRAIDLPSSLTSIGSGAFTSCEKLTQVRFWPSHSNLIIGDNLFTECWNLQFISLPNGITQLTPGLFSSCKTIFYLYIPGTVTSLAEVGTTSPFTSSNVGTIYFGGTEAEWNTMLNALRVGSLIPTFQTLSAAKVLFEQTDPLIPDISDSGGLISPCKDGHIGTPDANGNCSACGQPMESTSPSHQHSWSTDWDSDDAYHWHNCNTANCPITVNSAKDSYDEHDWSNLSGTCKVCKAACYHKMNSTTNTCDICGFVCSDHQWNTDGICNICHTPCSHQYEKGNFTCTICGAKHQHHAMSMLVSDATGHWHPCQAGENCPDLDSFKSDFAPHNYFTNNPKCATCGYIHQHTWSTGEVYGKDSEKHWRTCIDTTCPFSNEHPDKHNEITYHEYDQDGVCICGDKKSADTETHTWAKVWTSDDNYHWKACLDSNCDAQNYRAAHVYNQENDTCICGAKKPTSATPPCNHIDENGDNLCDKCNQPMPSTAHEATFASHSQTDFDATGACQHKGCNYTRSQFQADCPTNHSTITTNSTCPTCGAPGTKADTTTPSTPDTPSNPSTPNYPSYPYYPSTPTRPNTNNNIPKPETIRQPDGSTITITKASDGTITVNTGKTSTTRVTIPTTLSTPGTVAAIVSPNGSTTVVKTSVPSAGNLVTPLPDHATIKIIDNRKYFTDVTTDSWFDNAVAFVSARDLFSGTSPTTFSPDTPMTRAMLMTVLARLDGINTDSGATWYTNGMEWAMRRGISDGSSPNGNITREQLVVMLWRYLGSPTTTGSLSDHTDASQISPYATEAMRWATTNDIINGYNDGRLVPQGFATRAEVAQFLQNLIEYLTLKIT